MRRPDLDHIPGDEGLPLLGQTLRLIGDAEGWSLRAVEEFGPVFRTNILFARTVVFGTPDAATTILRDRSSVFSSEQGWGQYIGELFARGLMLRDFDDHRFHRRLMQEAFRSEAMRGYAAMMHPIIRRAVAAWPKGETIDLYDAFKRLTLDVTSEVFVGVQLGPEADAVNRAFVDTVAASVAPVRFPLPFTAYRRGLAGRRFLEGWFGARVDHRRRSSAADLFTRLCHAVDEEGRRFDDAEIVDHMIFLLMAAHDTTTSTLATMAWYLASHPHWQERLAEEGSRFGVDGVAYDRRDELVETEWVFREAMRLHPPVPFIPRRVLADTEVDGVAVPAGVHVVVSPLLIHRRPDLWRRPDVFDPERFGPGREEHRAHAHAWFPFSGGAHTCIGMHFAGLMAKAIVVELLAGSRLVAEPGQRVTIQTMPIPKPQGGLPLRLVPAG